jgi:ATP-dependent Clp protease ATP-binding subunit ClpA
VSAEAERIQDALDMYRMFEGTERREEMLERLRGVVEDVKQAQKRRGRR